MFCQLQSKNSQFSSFLFIGSKRERHMEKNWEKELSCASECKRCGGQIEEKAQRILDDYLDKLGFSVLRFTNRDIFNNIEGVLQKIYDRLGNPPNPL
jgi:hypothetical protein